MEEKRVIKPTVGRMLHYWPNGPAQKEGGSQPEAAIVAHVHGDRLVSVTAFTPSGHPYGATSVVLRQPDDVIATGAFAEWMEYQVGQAAKTDDVTRNLAEGQVKATLERAELFQRINALEALAKGGSIDEFREALAQADRENPVKSG